FKLRTQHIGVGNVILMTLVFTNWCDGKLTALCRIQQSTKNKIAVKAGHAHPLNFGRMIDVGNVGAIAHDAHVVFVYAHLFSWVSNPNTSFCVGKMYCACVMPGPTFTVMAECSSA